MQPRCDYSDMHLFVMTLFWSVLHVVDMTIILTLDQNLSQGIRWIKSWDHRVYPLTQPSIKTWYCLSTKYRLKKSLVVLSEGDLEEKAHSFLRTRLQVWLIKFIRFKGTHDKLMTTPLQVTTIVEITVFVKYYTW